MQIEDNSDFPVMRRLVLSIHIMTTAEYFRILKLTLSRYPTLNFQEHVVYVLFRTLVRPALGR